jgi:rubrerythrin
MLQPGQSLTSESLTLATANAANAPTPQAANESRHDSAFKYICPMPEHVSIEYDHSGNCPICGMTLVPVSAAALAKLQPGGKLLHYTCPMPEHADVRSDKPGKCPKCAMTLIPVMTPPPPLTPPSTFNPQLSTNVLYTCPMASHADVVSDKPGKCPKCDMKLVPTTTIQHGEIAEENWRKQHPLPTGVALPEHHHNE